MHDCAAAADALNPHVLGEYRLNARIVNTCSGSRAPNDRIRTMPISGARAVLERHTCRSGASGRPCRVTFGARVRCAEVRHRSADMGGPAQAQPGSKVERGSPVRSGLRSSDDAPFCTRQLVHARMSF
jgi:hypothetical protein